MESEKCHWEGGPLKPDLWPRPPQEAEEKTACLVSVHPNKGRRPVSGDGNPADNEGGNPEE